MSTWRQRLPYSAQCAYWAGVYHNARERYLFRARECKARGDTEMERFYVRLVRQSQTQFLANALEAVNARRIAA
jgi:hypothetical protein